jgi:hypothetical protein
MVDPWRRAGGRLFSKADQLMTGTALGLSEHVSRIQFVVHDVQFFGVKN